MDDLVNLAILQELEEQLQRDENNIQRRALRDSSDPFQMPEDLFVKYYRFDKQNTRDLVEMLRPHLIIPQKRSAVPTELKVLTMLYFLGHGSYQKCVGLNLNLCLEQSTVSNIISERCLLKHRVLHYDPVKAANIIYFCAILHNIAVQETCCYQMKKLDKEA